MNLNRYLFLFIICLVTAACNQVCELTPRFCMAACGDAKATSGISSAFFQSVDGYERFLPDGLKASSQISSGIQEMKRAVGEDGIAVRMIRTTMSNTNTLTVTCEAELVITVPESLMARVRNDPWWLLAKPVFYVSAQNEIRSDISYRVQLTDDRRAARVELDGHIGAARALVVVGAILSRSKER